MSSSYQSDTDKELEAVLGSHKTIIRIVGTGGAGNNTVTRLLEVGIKEVEVVAINTDAQDLLYAKADHKVLIGKNITNGLGAGSDPEKGTESAKESLQEIEDKLTGSDMVFITCGLGGGTGTGSAPVIAEVAKKVGALTIAVVTLPFSDEGIVRWDNARKGLALLQNHVDTVIVVQNDRLLDLVPDMPLNEAFKVADEILVNAVKGITELVTEKGLVNLDFADVRTIMQNGGLAMIGLGETDTDGGAEQAAEKALQNPLLDVDITGAKSALINISGGQELSLKAAKTVMKTVASRLDSSAKIIWGARLDEAMGSTIRVMLIVTCLQSHKHSASEIEMAIRKSDLDVPEQKPEPTSVGTEPAKEVETSEPAMVQTNGHKSGKKVFSDIFMEETDADLAVLAEAVKGLALGDRAGNEKLLREIKNACSSVYSSAELFGYSKIAELAELVEDITECAVNGEFELSESLIDLFRKIPQTVHDMMGSDSDAAEKADEIKLKFSNILELLTHPVGPEDAEEEEAASGDIEDKNGAGDGKGRPEDIQKGNGKSAGKKQSDAESSKEGHDNFSNVREAVKYFDKLF